MGIFQKYPPKYPLGNSLKEPTGFFENFIQKVPIMCLSHSLWVLSKSVIIMTFWYVYWKGLNFFELFKLYFHWGLVTNPHVFYDHMTYVYSFLICFSSHEYMAKRSHYHIMIFSTSEYYYTDASSPSFSISSSITPPLYSLSRSS